MFQKRFFRLGIAIAVLGLASCQTTQQAREIKLLGFDENVSKGENAGPIEGSDCTYQLFGYWMNGQPTLQRAVINARGGKNASLADSFGGSNKVGGDIRYFNNAVVTLDGFNVAGFGKQCIIITATGFK